MKYMFKKIAAFVIFFCMFYSYANALENPWVLISDKNGVLIYHRIPENSEWKEIKVTTSVNSGLSSIVSIILSVDDFVNWIYLCSESKTVKIVSDTEQYYYYISNTPWPLLNRDAVVYRSITQDSLSGKVVVNSFAKDTIVPVHEDMIRVTDLESSWILNPVSKNNIEIEYYMWIDPGGDIPSWLANYTMHYGPAQTFANFIRELNSLNKLPPPQIDEMKNLAGSFEALFSRRARNYKAFGLANKNLSDIDIRNYILKDYTFLKRPVVIIDDSIFIGNSINNVEQVKNCLK